MYAEQDKKRESSSKRGYDSRWRKIRKMKLSMNPLCEHCQKRGIIESAKEIDHIVPLRKGGTHQFDNLQSLCKSWHSRKTASETFHRD